MILNIQKKKKKKKENILLCVIRKHFTNDNVIWEVSEVGSCVDVWWVGGGSKSGFILLSYFFLVRFDRQQDT